MARAKKQRPERVVVPDLAEAQGARLKRARERVGWSLRDLAAASGVSMRTIQDVESGRAANVSARALAQLADALDVGRSWLAFGT